MEAKQEVKVNIRALRANDFDLLLTSIKTASEKSNGKAIVTIIITINFISLDSH